MLFVASLALWHAGALAISLYIIYSWVQITRGQVCLVVRLRDPCYRPGAWAHQILSTCRDTTFVSQRSCSLLLVLNSHW